MKKLIAVLLSIVCVFSCFGVTASAFDDIIGEIGGNLGLEPDSPIIYGITYEIDRFEGVKVMYKPSPTFSFSTPGTYTVTNDTPLSVDYEFIGWEHEETGKMYYAGDELYIDGQEVLIAVWREKTDNHIRPIRVILTAMEALRRTIGAFFGFYKIIDDFKADLATPKPTYEYFSLKDSEIIEINTDEDYEKDPRTYTIILNIDRVFDSNIQTVDVNFYGDKYAPTANGKNFPTHFTVTPETTEYNGKDCQFITISLVDGVESPATGTKLTVTIPKGFLKYAVKTNENGTTHYAANEEYTFSFLVTSYV